MRWLHVSDLHFNPKQDGRTSRAMREALPAYLQAHIGKVDAVFMTGDFRHARDQKDDPNAASNAVAFLRQIAQSVGVLDPALIHIVPGNHDLKRDGSEDGVKRIMDITNNYKVDIGHFGGEEAFLWERFSFFREAAGLLHGEESMWPEDLALLHPYRCFPGYSIVYMNTAIAMGRMIDKDGKKEDNDRGNMVIGNDALDLALRGIARENPQKPIIILAHHATELFTKREREAVEEVLKKYPVAAYLCGDAHEPWCSKINRVAEVTMGCIKHEDGVKAVFSLGELSPGGEVSITAHEWRSHPDGWEEYGQFNRYFADQFPPAFRPAGGGPKGPFGRDALIHDFSSRLNSMGAAGKRIIEVYGEPGIGKTTVCREVMKKAMPAECFESSLRGMTSYGAALDAILRSFDIPINDAMPLDAQIEAFAQARPNAVLYLDNAEDPLKDLAFKTWLLDTFPKKSSWRVIYSTRTTMKHSGVAPFRVPALDMPDAKAMFRSLFGLIPEADEAALEGLLSDLSCHPLSIVLVAAQKDLYPTVAGLHKAWRTANDAAHDRFSLEDDPGPHASLRSAIQMSFEAIKSNRKARVLWGMMSFLSAHMPRAVLELAFSDDPSSAETAVRALVKNCLLTTLPTDDGKDGYGMLSPLKDAAFAFDDPDDQERIGKESFFRLLMAFLTVFQKAGEFDAQDRQTAHHFALDIMPDAISFMESAFSKGAADTAALFELLISMGNYFPYNAPLSLDLLRKLEIPPDKKEISAFIYYVMGELESLLGQLDQAQAHYRDAERFYCGQRDNLGLGNVLKSMGDLESRLGQSDDAQAHYREAEGLYRQKRNNLGLANVLNSMGDLERRLGQFDQAQVHYREAEGLYRQKRDNLGLANVLNSMGDLERHLGQFDQAQVHYREAEGLYRQERANLGLANVLQSMGDLERHLGQAVEAQAYCREAEGLFRQERDDLGLANVLHRMGDLDRLLGQIDEAKAHYREAEELFRQERDDLGLANVLKSMGHLQREGKWWPQAIILYLQAMALYEKEHTPMGQAYTLGELCRAYAAIGDRKNALLYLECAKDRLPSLAPIAVPYVDDCIREALEILKISTDAKKKRHRPSPLKREKPETAGTSA